MRTDPKQMKMKKTSLGLAVVNTPRQIIFVIENYGTGALHLIGVDAFGKGPEPDPDIAEERHAQKDVRKVADAELLEVRRHPAAEEPVDEEVA